MEIPTSQSSGAGAERWLWSTRGLQKGGVKLTCREAGKKSSSKGRSKGSYEAERKGGDARRFARREPGGKEGHYVGRSGKDPNGLSGYEKKH
jgi:hypothetical protein